MKLRFIQENLREGDILCGRNNLSLEGELIRAIVGSESNHNAIIIYHAKHGYGIGDMSPPYGRFQPFSHYEKLRNDSGYGVRILRIKGITVSEGRRMSIAWHNHAEGKEYSSAGVKRLWIYKFINSLPWHIQGTWCTRAIGIICGAVFPASKNIFRKIYVKGMPLKKNETPRTVENRLVQGLLEDVTDQVMHKSTC